MAVMVIHPSIRVPHPGQRLRIEQRTELIMACIIELVILKGQELTGPLLLYRETEMVPPCIDDESALGGIDLPF